MMASHATFHKDSLGTIGKKRSAEKNAVGSPPMASMGMRRPRFQRSRSEKLAMHGSVTASQRRPAAARMTIVLRTVANVICGT